MPAQDAAGNAATVDSRDGARIAYERFGSGPAVILIGGALNDRNGRASGVALARALGTRLTAYAYDRRGRGDSTGGVADGIARETEDIAALIAEAGGTAGLFGMSSGAALAIAAATDPVVNKVAVYEPPFSTTPLEEIGARAYGAALQRHLAAGDNDQALALFLETVGVPAPVIAGMRAGAGWRPMAAMAPTLLEDCLVLDEANGAPVPTERLAAIAGPMLALAGERSPPQLRTAAAIVAERARTGSYRILAGQTHDVSIEALAPALEDFFAAR
jgi:pimeloyl-ACP methyl ester carboxylesterase